MQTVNRCAYALASYDTKTQSHDVYMEKKTRLEAACKEISSSAERFLSGTGFVATHARYSEEKYLTICYYKEHIFLGFQDRKTNNVSLNDTSNAFVNMPQDTPKRLSERMLNAIRDVSQNRLNIMNQQVTAMWKPILPMLDKIIEFEKEFNQLPDRTQQILINKCYPDELVDNIVSNKEDNSCSLINIDALLSENIGQTPSIRTRKNHYLMPLNDRIALVQKKIKGQEIPKSQKHPQIKCKSHYR